MYSQHTMATQAASKPRSPYATAMDLADAALHTLPYLLKAKELFRHLLRRTKQRDQGGTGDGVRVTQPALATAMHVSRRTVISHLNILRDHGLIWWRPGVGNICTYVITSYCPEPEVIAQPEVEVIGDGIDLDTIAGSVAPTSNDAFFTPSSYATNCTADVQPAAHLSFKEIHRWHYQAPQPPRGAGGGRGGSRRSSKREAIPETPSSRLLKAEGIGCAAEFADRPLADIERAIAYVNAMPTPPHDPAAFLVHGLRFGFYKRPTSQSTSTTPALRPRYRMIRNPDGTLRSEVIHADSA